jgi:hypothetical protein
MRPAGVELDGGEVSSINDPFGARAYILAQSAPAFRYDVMRLGSRLLLPGLAQAANDDYSYSITQPPPPPPGVAPLAFHSHAPPGMSQLDSRASHLLAADIASSRPDAFHTARSAGAGDVIDVFQGYVADQVSPHTAHLIIHVKKVISAG